MIKKREPKVPCKDVERRLASEREGGEERCNLDLISQPCPIQGSTSTSTYGRMHGLRKDAHYQGRDRLPISRTR
jgi:hypothetical protein